MDSTKESSLSQMFTWSGSRTSHGFAYEKDLAFTLFVAASLEERRFRLATEMKEAGKFDDAVLILDDRKEIWFFQAKHSQSSNAKIEYEEFFPSSLDENTQFSLPMYIQSFLNVSKRSEFRNYTKRFIIFTNKSIDENTTHKLGELMDIKSCELNDPLENKVFVKRTEKYVPKAEQIQGLLKKVNELPVAIKDAIIELQRTGTVKSILRKYTTPLRSILKIDSSVRFSETFTENEDEVNQRWLWHELQTHYATEDETTKRLSEVIFSKKVDKRLLQNKSGETSFPRFIEESDLRSFLECLLICTDQPDKLSLMRDKITESVVRKWVDEKDRCLISDRAKLHVVFGKEFENWHMVTNLEGNQKPFLSSYEGNMCVQMTQAEVRRILQKVTAADFNNYVERKLASRKGQENYTEDRLIAMLEQSSGRNGYILVGKPGMGKTTFMKKITYSLQADYNKHAYLICLSRLFKNYEGWNDIFTLVKSAFSKTIQQFIQNSLENYPNQCFILLDGFDEIDTLHQGAAIKLIKETFCKNNIRVFISGRNHVKKILEEELQVETFNLVPLAVNEQLLLLRNYWDISSEISQEEFERFELFAERLLQLLHDSIQSNYFYFTGLPLMVRMLAEVNKEKFEKYWRLTNKHINEILELENKFSVLRLYESFVNISFNIFIKKIINEEGYASVDSKVRNFFKDNLNKFYHAHQIIAISQLNVPELRETLSKNDSVTILENMQQILDDGEKSLLINVSNKNQLEFTHLSYAEYFLSKFLYDHVLDWEAILFNVLKEHVVVRAFFFLMIEENWENSKLQMDAINQICHKTPDMMYFACSGGYELILKELLNHYEAKQLFETGTLLHAAVVSKKENILKLVLCDHQFGDCTHHGASNNKTETYESEIDINTPDSQGALPIHYAVSAGNKLFVKMLAQHGADKSINAQDINGNTPLHNAAEQDDVEMVKLLIDKYFADYKIVNTHGHTLIHVAAKSGNMELVHMLKDDYAADVNAQDNDGNTPFLLAAKCYDWEMAMMLIYNDSKYSIDNNIADKNGHALIHLAVKEGSIEIVQMLRDDYAADINAQDNDGNTPLLLAAKNCEWEMVEMLIDKDSKNSADYKIANEDGQTLIHLAAAQGNMELVQMLKDGYAIDVNAQDNDGNTPLLLAAKNRKWEMVKMFIDKDSKYYADYKIADAYGQTLIHLAAEVGNMEIVQMLEDGCAEDVNSQDNDGNTPLFLAALRHEWDLVKTLIDKDSKYSAYCKIANEDGQTLTHLAAKSGNIEIVQMLRDDYAADVNAQDNDGNTPLLLAVKNRRWNLVKTLINKESKYSADYKIANEYGQTLIHLAAKEGNLEIVQMLIDDYAADVNARDNNGNTPLLLAAKNREWEMVKMLINKDSKYSAYCKITNKDGHTLIHLAAKEGNLEIVQMLIDDYAADVNARDNDGNTPLLLAVKNRRWNLVKTLINKESKYSADYKIANEDGQTLIHLAAEKGNMEFVQMLIDDYAADVNAQDNNGSTPLHFAAMNDEWKMVKMLKDGYAADINAQDNDGNTPLLLAAKYWRWDLVKKLIDKDSKYPADYKIVNKDGQTLIHLAAQQKNMEIVQMLKDGYSVDVNAQDSDGNTPLFLAAKCHDWDLVKKLIDKDYKYFANYKNANEAGQTLIHLAARGGNMEIVQMLIGDYAAGVNAQDNDGNTPLHYAAMNDEWKMVKMLIDDYGADVNAQNNNGSTPLHFAAMNDEGKMVKKLIDHYAADVNARDNKGNTPFHFAVMNAGWKMGKMLIDDYAADVNAQNNNGSTPLHFAARFGTWYTFEKLIDKDSKYSADYKIANKSGQILIHVAAEGGNMKIVQMLIDNYAADVNAQDNKGKTPLHFAVMNDEWEMVKMLIDDYGADVNAQDNNGNTLLHFAVVNVEWKMVKLLIDDYGADINAQDNDGNTAFHFAAKFRKWDTFKKLIDKDSKYSADYKIANKYGQILIHVAAEGGNMEIVQMLIDDYGADVNAQDNNGCIPLHFAAANDEWKMVKMLIDDYAVDINAQDNKGNTSLHLAAMNKKWDMVQMIINTYSADCQIVNENGQTLIHLASVGGGVKTVKMLIENFAADVNTRDNDGNTPLHYAATEGEYKIVKMLIADHRANLYTANNNGQTPFHAAAMHCQWDVVRMLLVDFSLDVNSPDEHGQTLLHLAAERNDLEAVKMLVNDYLADTNYLDNRGRIPFEVAASCGNIEVVDELTK